MYCRRAALPQVNKGRGYASPAWFEGWGELDIAAKWSLLVYLHDLQAPPPHETVLRTLRHRGFHLHLATPVSAVRRVESGVELTLASAKAAADFLIVGTGFRVDLAHVAPLAEVAPFVALWNDRYTPPAGLQRRELGRFPYLGPGFELLERQAGCCPGLSRVHLFNHGAYASLGPIASDIPGASLGADRLARAISRHFFREDFGAVRAALEAFDEPELIDTPFYVVPEQRL
jgi:acetolactate synthase regulatory subunit